MMADDRGVAGFFEDLPVLMFVLAGVFIIVAAGVWTSDALASQRFHDKLEGLAEELVNDIIHEVTVRAGANQLPSLDILTSLNLGRVAADSVQSHCYSIAIVERFPTTQWLVNCSKASGSQPFEAAGSALLLNALDSHLRVVVVEVEVLVW
jgi:hypothetical protein